MPSARGAVPRAENRVRVCALALLALTPLPSLDASPRPALSSLAVRRQTRVRWEPPRQADLWQARQHRRAAGEGCNEQGRDLHGSNAAPHSTRRAGTAHWARCAMTSDFQGDFTGSVDTQSTRS